MALRALFWMGAKLECQHARLQCIGALAHVSKKTDAFANFDFLFFSSIFIKYNPGAFPLFADLGKLICSFSKDIRPR